MVDWGDQSPQTLLQGEIASMIGRNCCSHILGKMWRRRRSFRLFFVFVFLVLKPFWVVFIRGVGSCLLFYPCRQHSCHNWEVYTGESSIQCWDGPWSFFTAPHTCKSSVFINFSLFSSYGQSVPHFISTFFLSFFLSVCLSFFLSFFLSLCEYVRIYIISYFSYFILLTNHPSF